MNCKYYYLINGLSKDKHRKLNRIKAHQPLVAAIVEPRSKI
jgi:hypothetical protein